MNTRTSIRKSFHDKEIIPCLENGDRLTRDEFHRRYEAMPSNVRAELIRGIVYMASPVSLKKHGEPHAKIMSCLGVYQMSTSGIRLSDNVTFIASDTYEPQPDGVLRIDEKYGGKSWRNKDDYLEGTPELIVEISSSSVSYDLHDKLELYEAKGVQEYIVWRVIDEQIDWFSLENGKYQKIFADNKGVVESKIFPGLRLNVEALLADDMKRVLTTVQAGLASESYNEFAASLAAE